MSHNQFSRNNKQLGKFSSFPSYGNRVGRWLWASCLPIPHVRSFLPTLHGLFSFTPGPTSTCVCYLLRIYQELCPIAPRWGFLQSRITPERIRLDPGRACLASPLLGEQRREVSGWGGANAPQYPEADREPSALHQLFFRTKRPTTVPRPLKTLGPAPAPPERLRRSPNRRRRPARAPPT